MSLQKLDAVEARILGCLLEKERLTPENYPLSLNSLAAACNQSTNRDPMTSYDDRTVDAGVTSLREKRLATMIHSAGARVQKYRHNLPDHFDLNPGEVALLCVLLLRGPQTPCELRARTERMYGFGSIESVEAALEGLGKGSDPLVKVLPARPGQKERRYVQLLSDEPEPAEVAVAYTGAAPAPSRSSEHALRIEALEGEVAALKEQMASLREEFLTFRKQFE